MTRRPTRPSKPASQPTPDPTMPTDVAALQEQLRLARAQNAYLHRELAAALKQGPLAPSSFHSDEEALRAENRDLRERLTLLTRHYEDLQNRYALLEHASNRQEREFNKLLRSVCGGAPGAFQTTLVETPMDLTPLLTKLLVLAHPDKWSQGQSAIDLAHELTIVINSFRGKVGGQA